MSLMHPELSEVWRVTGGQLSLLGMALDGRVGAEVANVTGGDRAGNHAALFLGIQVCFSLLVADHGLRPPCLWVRLPKPN